MPKKLGFDNAWDWWHSEHHQVLAPDMKLPPLSSVDKKKDVPAQSRVAFRVLDRLFSKMDKPMKVYRKSKSKPTPIELNNMKKFAWRLLGESLDNGSGKQRLNDMSVHHDREEVQRTER